MYPTKILRWLSCAACCIALASVRVSAMGFSMKTCLPACAASMAHEAWYSSLLATNTRSMSSRRTISALEV